MPTSEIPRAVGSTFDLRVREGRRISHYEGRINSYDPPKHLGVSMWGGAFPRGIVMRVPLEGGGRLVVELTPDEARDPALLADLDRGHDVLLRQALAHLGHPV